QIDSDIDQEVGIILTANSDAYQYYLEGRKLFNRGDWSGSILAFEKAIENDSEFAMAYRNLASAYSNDGNPTKADEYRQKALDNIDRLSYLERMIIEGQYRIKGAIEKINWFENLYKEYPQNYFVNSTLGYQYNLLEDWDEVIDHYEFLRKNGDEFIYDYIRLGLAYRKNKMYAKAREVFQDYIDKFADSADMHFYIYLTYVIEGNYERALAIADKFIGLNSEVYIGMTYKEFQTAVIPHLQDDFTTAEQGYKSMLEEEHELYQTMGRRLLEMLYRTQGQTKKAAEEALAGLKYAEENNLMDSIRTFTRILADLDLLTGDMDGALGKAEILWNTAADEDINQWDSLDIKLDALARINQANVGKNDLAKAEETLEEMKAIVDDSPRPKDVRWYRLSLGLLEMKRNNYSSAAELFTQAYEMQGGQRDWVEPHAFMLYNLASAYQLSGDLESAKREYENILALTTGRLYWGDLYVKSYYQLGKIYEQLGDKAKAIEYYEKFLDLWKDADPGLPEVDDARKRLAGMSR
ncbi:tetratricopeptide repeat protein, partial [Acidobacteriota bacterium]